MFDFQVETPILNNPFEEPLRHWHIVEGESPQIVEGRRLPIYFYRPPGFDTSKEYESSEEVGIQIELKLVSLIRKRIAEWRAAGYPGAGNVTLELLAYWSRDGREKRLFFAQREAAEAVIFLTEARTDYLQGINIPSDEPGNGKKEQGYRAFHRLCCKMATGSGKTTVMGMLAAWNLLNKAATRNDKRFSDTILIVCPNVTIRSRLGELDPNRGEASLYRSRDLVPPHLMGPLSQGRVLVLNWHVFEPQQANRVGNVASKVVKTGQALTLVETIRISDKSTTARGTRYLTLDDFQRQRGAGLIEVLQEERDASGSLVRVQISSTRYVESDAAWLKRVLGVKSGRKQNIFIMNDEAHHAYRLRSEAPDDIDEEDEFIEEYVREATIWIDGLDRIHKQAGISSCIDFSATPYYLAGVGQDANRPFPWVVSDFGLIEAIEAGLTKIPQFAVRDLSGQSIPGYFNIWRWILPQLKPSERGGKKSVAKPEAILRYAYTPIVMLGGLWQQLAREWREDGVDPRPPVFIIVCKNTKLAKVVYEWLAEDAPPPGIPSAGLSDFLNKNGLTNTIRVDSAVVSESDSDNSKSDDVRWMRLTLDTVGRLDWPKDLQGSPIYPEGFIELADKLKRPLNPPGRDVRAIVSVGMLTEGWDCNTVTHIVGLRPFMSQLLCEQVVGRGLRRASYEIGEDGLMGEEVAQIFGVPFQVVPFKANKGGIPRPPVKTWRVRALPERAQMEIRFPRVEGYYIEPSHKIDFVWDEIPTLEIDPTRIPPEVEMKAGLPTNQGRPTLYGPGKVDTVTLTAFRLERRLQSHIVSTAKELMRNYLVAAQTNTEGDPSKPPMIHPAILFPRFVAAIDRFVASKVVAREPSKPQDVFLAPYYGLMVERLMSSLRTGELQEEKPRYERHRGLGTTEEVEFITRREPFVVEHSHVNYVVADSQWERTAAYVLDKHAKVHCFVKNSGLGFSIPYTFNGQTHDYLPDFIVRLEATDERYLIVETKGFDERIGEKNQAACRWVSAVNTDGRYGIWSYLLLRNKALIAEELQMVLNSIE